MKTSNLDNVDLIEIDLERAKFLAKDYLRIRLSKIEKYLYSLIHNNQVSLLSKNEFEFALELFKMKREYFNESLYSKINNSLNDLKTDGFNEEVLVYPNINDYVFIKSYSSDSIVVNLRDIDENANNTLIISNDDILCLPYQLIR